MAISDLMILVGDSKDASAPAGWTRMGQDLNEGAGGKFIYLAYKDTPSGPFITDITFAVGDSSSVAAPAGYTRLPQDLNEGAGGKFIYLCFSRGDGLPITNLGLGSTSRPLPYGDGPFYMMIPQDLNQGAKGRYIYLHVGRYRSRWMEDLAAHIKDRPLNRIALPGTHDSGTYSLSPTSPISRDASTAVYDARAVSGMSSRVYDWALTQNLSISQQLEAGIRYLDVRVLDRRAADLSGNAVDYGDADKALFVAHSMYGCRVEEIFDQVEGFLRKNTREIVILRLGTNGPGSLTERGKRHLVHELLYKRLGDLMAPRKLGPRVTPAALWAAGKRLIVMVNNQIWADMSPGAETEWLWNEVADDGRGFPALLQTSDLPDAGTGKLSVLKSALDREIADTYNQSERFQMLGCCLTPDDASIIKGTLSDWFEPLTSTALGFWNKVSGQSASDSTPRTLHEGCAMQATPAAERWMRNDWGNETVNIVCTDFFSLSQTVDLCLLRNTRPRRFYIECMNLVVDLPGGATQAGTKPIIWTHNTPQSANQQWILDGAGRIRSVADSNMVLDIEGNRAAPGTQVILWTVHEPPTANQQWDIDSEGRVRSRLDSNLVLDVKNGSRDKGTELIVWSASSPVSANQRFTLRES